MDFFQMTRAVMMLCAINRMSCFQVPIRDWWSDTMTTSLFRVHLLVLALVGGAPVFEASPVAGDDDKKTEKVLPAAEARKHVGKECTFEMKVKASKNAAKRKTYFLDSEEDFHDEKNLSVVISYDHADKFSEAGIADPSQHFKDKTIHVTGKVIEEDDQIRIRVEDPKKIEIIEPK
jgi:hypothetical protein